MSFAWWNIYSTVIRCKKKQMNACGSISIRCHPLLPKEGILLPVCALYKVCWFKPCGTSANERTLRTLKNELFFKKKNLREEWELLLFLQFKTHIMITFINFSIFAWLQINPKTPIYTSPLYNECLGLWHFSLIQWMRIFYSLL